MLREPRFALPDEAFNLYLRDPFAREFMAQMGWSIDPADYGRPPSDRRADPGAYDPNPAPV